MLKADYFGLNLSELHARVANNVDAWLSNPENRLVREGNAKTGTRGRHGLMLKTKGLVLHDCPGATDACRKSCQMIRFACWRSAGKYDTAWESVYSYLAWNDLEKLEKVLSRDLTYFSAFAKVIVRVHEAGDFVSPGHALVYENLAKAFSQVKFFGYTHSVHDENVVDVLERANTLPNFLVRESADESRLQVTGRLPVAYYGDRKLAPKRFAIGRDIKPVPASVQYPPPAGYMNCPEQYGDHKTKCADCMLCLTNPRDVFFIPQQERIQMEKARNEKLRDQGVVVKRRYGVSKKDRAIREQTQAAATAKHLAKKEKAS